MGLKIGLGIGCALLLFSCGQESEGTSSSSVEDESRSGQLIYERHCETCHGPDGKQGTAGAKDLSISKLDSTAIVNLLKNGKNGMPRQMQNIESDEELNNLLDHINALRK